MTKFFAFETTGEVDFEDVSESQSIGENNTLYLDNSYAYSQEHYAQVAEPIKFGATYITVNIGDSTVAEFDDDTFHAWQGDVMTFFENTDDDIAESSSFNALCDTTDQPILFSPDVAADIAQVMEECYPAFGDWIGDPGYTTEAESEEFCAIWENVMNIMLEAAETGAIVVKEF